MFVVSIFIFSQQGLTVLNLDNNRIGIKGAEALADALRNNTVSRFISLLI